MTRADLIAAEAAACLSWALDLLDLYDAKMIRDGERESDVLSELHVEAKMRARKALEAISGTR
jgi:hypothetical protein